MAKPTVLVTRRVPQAALDILERACDVQPNVDDRPYPPDELSKRARDVDAIVATLTDRIDADLIGSLVRCRVVANVAVGFDNIDTEAARARGLTITNTPGVLTDATADFAMALMLATTRRVVEGDRFVRDGAFTGWNLMMLLGMDLAGATLGLVGFGRIGQAVAKRARAFGMHIIYTDEGRASSECEAEYDARFVDKATLLAQSDVVSLHVPLTPATRHYIGAPELHAMKSSAFLINTARGAAVDEGALVAALREGTIAGAGLDVFEHEPQIAHGLAELPSVVLAPHIASAGTATRTRMATMAAQNVVAVLEGREALNRIV